MPSSAAATPMTRAQPNSPTVGWLKGGSPGMAREKVPSPVQLSRPTKISEPIPAASRPGSSTTPIMAPASPDASISRKAPRMGDPKSVLIEAKLPEEASTDRA